jgi:hypothetical protein
MSNSLGYRLKSHGDIKHQTVHGAVDLKSGASVIDDKGSDINITSAVASHQVVSHPSRTERFTFDGVHSVWNLNSAKYGAGFQLGSFSTGSGMISIKKIYCKLGISPSVGSDSVNFQIGLGTVSAATLDTDTNSRKTEPGGTGSALMKHGILSSQDPTATGGTTMGTGGAQNRGEATLASAVVNTAVNFERVGNPPFIQTGTTSGIWCPNRKDSIASPADAIWLNILGQPTTTQVLTVTGYLEIEYSQSASGSGEI